MKHVELPMWKFIPGFPETFKFFGCDLWSEVSSCSKDIHDLIVVTKNISIGKGKLIKGCDIHAACKIHSSENDRIYRYNNIAFVHHPDNIVEMTLQEFEIFAIQNS